MKPLTCNIRRSRKQALRWSAAAHLMLLPGRRQQAASIGSDGSWPAGNSISMLLAPVSRYQQMLHPQRAQGYSSTFSKTGGKTCMCKTAVGGMEGRSRSVDECASAVAQGPSLKDILWCDRYAEDGRHRPLDYVHRRCFHVACEPLKMEGAGHLVPRFDLLPD